MCTPNTWFVWPIRPTNSNCNLIEWAIFPEFTVITNRQTHGQTNRLTKDTQHFTGKNRLLMLSSKICCTITVAKSVTIRCASTKNVSFNRRLVF